MDPLERAAFLEKNRKMEVAHSVAATAGETEFCRYLAPEYTEMGMITEKADVYAFGVVLLELLTGIEATKFSLSRPSFQEKVINEGFCGSFSGVYCRQFNAWRTGGAPFLGTECIKGDIDATGKLPCTSRLDQYSHGENGDSDLRFALNDNMATMGG